MQPIVIALGGNALIKHHQIGDYQQQVKNVEQTCRQIAAVAKKHPVVLTHGNGPQVGNLQIQMMEAKKIVPPMPLHVDVAMTQAQIGFMLQQAMKKELPGRQALTVVTEVLVDSGDNAFKNPSKPIGPILSKKEADDLKRKGFSVFFEKARGWRKVVASPKPKKIIQLDAIRELLGNGFVVIACGGGGIPVVGKGKNLRGIEAVIDKDNSAQVLANALNAKTLVILTDVEFVYLDFGKKSQKRIQKVKARELEKYLRQEQFASGSMRPKIEAAVEFIRRGGKRVIICSLNNLCKALEGKTGTCIVG